MESFRERVEFSPTPEEPSGSSPPNTELKERAVARDITGPGTGEKSTVGAPELPVLERVLARDITGPGTGDKSTVRVNLRLILVSGRTKEFLFTHSSSAADITDYVYSLQLPLGKTTVMHLVARENLPEPNNQGQLKKDKSGEASCSLCCVLL
ncbi:UBL3-like protein [Mya arenaria]|uniref:UBL3-like protein n=1 Tax=Mya arenaria TaxID=6604 RepID=A0ABY7DPB0_MYAAR|nr:UBL3-like protein [Mya arenaria]